MATSWYTRISFRSPLSRAIALTIHRALLDAVARIHERDPGLRECINSRLQTCAIGSPESTVVQQFNIDPAVRDFVTPTWGTKPGAVAMPYSAWSPELVEVTVRSDAPDRKVELLLEVNSGFQRALSDIPSGLADFDFQLPVGCLCNPLTFEEADFETELQWLTYSRLHDILSWWTMTGRHDQFWQFNQGAICYLFATPVSLFPIRRIETRHAAEFPCNQDVDTTIEIYPGFIGPSLSLNPGDETGIRIYPG